MRAIAAAATEAVAEAERAFRARYPEYQLTDGLDDLRATDYARIDRGGHVYLDYTGAGLYGMSQVRAHADLLAREVYGNPHSINPSSLSATGLVDEARAEVRATFNASPEEYAVVFTQNASGALKLVAEAFPFDTRGCLLLTFDNHNSVNGIREYARARGAKVRYAPIVLPDLRLDAAALERLLERRESGAANLFAYPAQSNFSGVKHPLEWVARAQALGWQVLLDAAAYVPTSPLDLRAVKPDFVSVSFYKMFGYPTGVGCLLARRSALGRLRRPWFAGGTITVASVQGDRHYLHEGEEAFEDGTLNYLGLGAVSIGLRHFRRIGHDQIAQRITPLLAWLLEELAKLRHANGAPVVRVYGPVDLESRGATVTFNVFDPQGTFIDHRIVEAQASAERISLRTGCFCNPGGGEVALQIGAQELGACFDGSVPRLTLDDFRRCIDGKSTGAVRVSLGPISNFADVFRCVEFVRGFVDRSAASFANGSHLIPAQD